MNFLFEIGKSRIFRTCGFLIVWASGAHAEDCNNLSGGIGLASAQISYQCAEKDRQSSDAKLNSVYRKLLGAVKDDPNSGASTKSNLIVAQKSWIAFRDAECDLSASLSGSASQWIAVNRSQCLKELTDQRVTVLQDYFRQAIDR